MGKKSIVCGCKHVTEADIRHAVDSGATTFKQVKSMTGAGSKCGKCKHKVQRIIQKELERLESERLERDQELVEDIVADDEMHNAAEETAVEAIEAEGPGAKPEPEGKPDTHRQKPDIAMDEDEPAVDDRMDALGETSNPEDEPADSPADASSREVAVAASEAARDSNFCFEIAERSGRPALHGAPELRIHGVYRHFKGDYYIVEDVARHSETGEEYVVYRKLYGDGSLWIRPRKMFLSPVDRQKYPDAGQRWRFELQRIRSVAR